jgi:hypothetical protein
MGIMKRELSRRSFLTKSAASSASFYLLPHAIALKSASAGEPGQSPGPRLGFFSDEEFSVLEQLCEQVLPDSTQMGAANYIENLLTAFEVDPPRIFAGGPFSGRKPYPGATHEFPENSFKNFIPLSRAQEVSWKLKLYGSTAFPGGWWNEKIYGPRKGLRELFKEGIAAAASDDSGPALGRTSSEFRATIRELIVEGCFAAPEYGGNHDLQGWKLASFPGDSQPLGYTDDEVTLADAHDPDSLSWIAKAFLFFSAVFNKGKEF